MVSHDQTSVATSQMYPNHNTHSCVAHIWHLLEVLVALQAAIASTITPSNVRASIANGGMHAVHND